MLVLYQNIIISKIMHSKQKLGFSLLINAKPNFDQFDLQWAFIDGFSRFFAREKFFDFGLNAIRNFAASLLGFSVPV
jgi:hypothetical protein